MSMLDYDISIGVSILHGNEHFPDNYNYIYISTNEFVSGYYKNIPLEGKRVLTVAASGDHILQAVCNGAKAIDTFDKNRLQIYFAKLKITAMKALSREEFDNYFDWNDPQFLDKKIYIKIREFLDSDVCLFWDKMYVDGWLDKFYDSIINYYSFIDNGLGNYRSCDSYEETKSKLDSVDISFSHSDLHSYVENLGDNRYDAVFLSNIYDHLSFFKRKKFNKFINEELAQHLTEDGVIVAYAPVAEKNLSIVDYNNQRSFDRGKVYIYRRDNNHESN